MQIRFTLLLLTTIGFPLVCQAADGLRLQLFEESVMQYDRLEFAIEGVAQYEHPHDASEVDLSILMQTPAGAEVRLPAFWIQAYERQQVQRSGKLVVWRYPSSLPAWRARYAPHEVGAYAAVAELTDTNGTRRSKPVHFTCTASDSKGFVRVSQSDPRYFEFSTGQPFFPIGQNLAFIGENQQAYCWLFDPAASFEQVVIHQSQPQPILDVRLEIGKLVPGTYRVEWWETRTGKVIAKSDVPLANSPLQLTVPRWQRDIACKVTKVP